MPSQLLMPALSPTMEEGKLAKWLIAEGDPISTGMVIAEIESDKATMEVEAIDDGRMGRILVDAGTDGVKVNTVIAVILGDGEDASTVAPFLDRLEAAQGVAPDTPDDGPSNKVTATAGTGTNGQAAPASSVEPTPLGLPPASATAATQSAPTALPQTPPAPAITSDDPAPSAGTQELSTREALRDAMAEEMRRDADVFLMGEEVGQYQGAYKVSQGLLDEFGDKRVIDTPITEQGFAGIGVGAAFAGLKPIVEFMTWNFAMQAIDQIVNSAAKTLYMSGGQMGCPIVFRGPNGAATRVAAQHSQCFSAWYAHVPGMKVVAPSNARDAKGLLKAAIRDPNPVLVLENELLYSATAAVPLDTDWTIPIGKARIARAGSHVTIVSFARAMTYALAAAEQLARDGIEAEVIDLRSLRPIDWDTVLASVRKTNRIVTVEEAWPVCSVGSEICAQVAIQAFDDLDAPPAKISGADVPMPYAANLETLALPRSAQVVEAAKAVCYL